MLNDFAGTLTCYLLSYVDKIVDVEINFVGVSRVSCSGMIVV